MNNRQDQKQNRYGGQEGRRNQQFGRSDEDQRRFENEHDRSRGAGMGGQRYDMGDHGPREGGMRSGHERTQYDSGRMYEDRSDLQGYEQQGWSGQQNWGNRNDDQNWGRTQQGGRWGSDQGDSYGVGYGGSYGRQPEHYGSGVGYGGYDSEGRRNYGNYGSEYDGPPRNRGYDGGDWVSPSSGNGGNYRTDSMWGVTSGGGNRGSQPGERSSQDYSSQSGQHFGRGPKGYRRSDERIHEDVCEALSRNPQIDASDIEVRVSGGEVTLSGTVQERYAKRMAEDIVERCSGVGDVKNEIRVARETEMQNNQQNKIKGTSSAGATRQESKTA